MALLQVHQAKALRDLHEGGHDPQVHHELRAAMDLALRATKVTARAVGRAMSTLLVQERHLWLCLADMRDTDKVRFLNSPVSQTGLFGDAVENFAQQIGSVTGQACAGPYGQYCDRCVHQPSRRSALPLHVATCPPSPPLESEASEVASRHSCPWCAQPCGRRALTSCAARRVATPPPGGPADLGGVRRGSGRPVCLARNLPLPVVLLPVRGDTRHRCTGAQLAPGHSQVCVSPSEPTCTDLVQSQGGRGAGFASCALLAQPDLVPGTHAPRDSPSLASSSEKGPSFSETGHPLAPASRPLETPCLVPGQDAEVLGDLPPEVLNTIASARAPSTRRAYALKWNLFVKWCSSRQEDPRRCSIGVVLSFFIPPPSRFMLPLYPHTTTTSMVSRLVSTTWSSGSLGGQDG